MKENMNDYASRRVGWTHLFLSPSKKKPTIPHVVLDPSISLSLPLPPSTLYIEQDVLFLHAIDVDGMADVLSIITFYQCVRARGDALDLMCACVCGDALDLMCVCVCMWVCGWVWVGVAMLLIADQAGSRVLDAPGYRRRCRPGLRQGRQR